MRVCLLLFLAKWSWCFEDGCERKRMQNPLLFRAEIFHPPFETTTILSMWW